MGANPPPYLYGRSAHLIRAPSRSYSAVEFMLTCAIPMPRTLTKAQRAQAAGAPVVAEVFTHMWHDFMQETEGCGAGHPMAEAVNAVQRLGHFLKNNETCRVVCENGKCGGYGAVKWHFRYNELPTPTPKDC